MNLAGIFIKVIKMGEQTCRCCLALPPDKDLKETIVTNGVTEVYADMLKECFEIHLQIKGGEAGDSGICEMCIADLRTAYNFKQQVLRCQKEFDLRLLNGMQVKDEQSMDVKVETVDLDEDNDSRLFMEMKEEYLDYDSSNDDKNLALLALEQLACKREAKKKKKRRELKLKGAKKLKEDRIIKSLQPSPLTKYVSDVVKHKQNVATILKHSNATIFANRNIHGFVCAFCKTTVADLNDLRQHNEKHQLEKLDSRARDSSNISVKLDITDLKCNLCSHNFDDIACLKKHLVSEHSVKFHADVHDFILEFKLNNFSEGMMNCALCSSTYETFKMLLQHMNGHYRNFVCDLCDMGFINYQKLKNHKRTHDTGNFKCCFCEKVFGTRVKRACHEKYTHKNGARYITNCPHCEQSFTSYYQRNRHMLKDHNSAAASYKCNICERDFLMKSKLTYHIKKVHLMERNHKCNECGQGFFMKQCLEDHMIKHKGERIHKCNVCQKAYARKKTLREHMRIHNNDRRFKCGVCGLAFVQKCSLKSHMLSNHGLTLTEFENTRPVVDVDGQSTN